VHSVIIVTAILSGVSAQENVAGFFHVTVPKSPKHKFVMDIIGTPPQTNDSPIDTNGQSADFGGALQYYSIFGNQYTNAYAKSMFGANIALYLARDRVELFGGTGGVFVPEATSYTRPDSWLTQAKFGARVALDKGHHLWLGTTAYYLTNFAEKTRQWGYASGDLTVEFGH
jgi:hypothetical protein